MAARRSAKIARSGDRSVPAVQGSAGVSAIEIGRFRVSSTVFGACVLPWHYHDRACLSVLLTGGFSERFVGRSVECQTAGVLAKPAGERHHDVMHGSHQVIVEPDPQAEIAWPEMKRVFGGVSYGRSDVVWAIAARLATELEAPDAFTALAVEGLTLELFSALLRSTSIARDTSSKPAWLTLVRERIEHDPRITSVDELATIANVHPAYLARCFRRQYAVSIGQYARRVRLQWAAQRLSTTDESVSSIALRAGFADQSHFTRAFRAHSGLTPRQFRLATRVTRRAGH
jgi:AraC family transcriptional regulator